MPLECMHLSTCLRATVFFRYTADRSIEFILLPYDLVDAPKHLYKVVITNLHLLSMD